MTHVIQAANVNEALPAALWYMKVAGLPETSRNGPVLVAPGPVVTEYLCPTERVLFCPVRDANPVFHLMEALWMIAGARDLEWLIQFNARFASYAEAGTTLQWGAYGHRWRSFFGYDQILAIVATLRKDPNSRRAVMAMWDGHSDLTHEGPDIPCNTHAYFDLRGGALNMTVCCRSNDLLWGAYGANAVHFSILQELVAHELRVTCGIYRQMSNNFHIYTELPIASKLLDCPSDTHDLYLTQGVTVVPLLVGATLEELTQDCVRLVADAPREDMVTTFVHDVAAPLRDMYQARKRGEPITHPDVQVDWFVAFSQWHERREA